MIYNRIRVAGAFGVPPVLCPDILLALVFFHSDYSRFIDEIVQFIIGMSLYLDPCDAMARVFLEQRHP